MFVTLPLSKQDLELLHTLLCAMDPKDCPDRQHYYGLVQYIGSALRRFPQRDQND